MGEGRRNVTGARILVSSSNPGSKTFSFDVETITPPARISVLLPSKIGKIKIYIAIIFIFAVHPAAGNI